MYRRCGFRHEKKLRRNLGVVRIAGIDEAGYGPLLGPLCVGVSVFHVEQWGEGEAAPNLWKLLSAGVCRKPTELIPLPRADAEKYAEKVLDLCEAVHQTHYLQPDVADGSTATATSAGNNGQQVLVQATIESALPDVKTWLDSRCP